MKINPFKLFKKDIGQNELKKSYLDLIRSNPPEKNPEKFKEIRKAYEMIKNADSPYELLSLSVLNPNEEISKDNLIKFLEDKLSLRKEKITIKRKILLEELNDIRN